MPSDVVILVPKLDELRAISWAFGLDLAKGAEDRVTTLEVHLYFRPLEGLRVCFAFLDGQDNVRAGLATFQVLTEERPKAAFLVGTALGDASGAQIASVVVSTRVQYMVELETRLPEILFRNTTLLEQPSSFALRARNAVLNDFTQEHLAMTIREACGASFLPQPVNSESILGGQAPPTVLEERIGSSNVYFRDVGDANPGDSAKALVFDKAFGVKLYDMESSGFAKAALALGVPWAVFRGISDFGRSQGPSVRMLAAAAAARCLGSVLTSLVAAPAADDPRIEYELAGDWQGLFVYLDSQGIPSVVRDNVELRQYGTSRAVATVKSERLEGSFGEPATTYTIDFDSFRSGYVYGSWADSRPQGEYFGVVFAKLDGHGRVLRGQWLGNTSTTPLPTRNGAFAWYNVISKGQRTDVTVPDADELRDRLIEDLVRGRPPTA